MARCHRIGQTREVTVYRLITRDTYEEQLFSTASRKYGESLCALRPSSCQAASACMHCLLALWEMGYRRPRLL